MGDEAPPVPLRIHFSDVVHKNWSELPPRFTELLPSLGAPEGDVLITHGAGCPADTNICVAGGPAITAENLRPALDAGSLKGVVLPHAGIPPNAKATLLAPEFARVKLFNLHHNARPTAEIGITLMLATSRRLLPADRALRQGSWEGKQAAATGAVQCGLGGVVLVLGFGEIGKVVAGTHHLPAPSSEMPREPPLLSPGQFRAQDFDPSWSFVRSFLTPLVRLF